MPPQTAVLAKWGGRWFPGRVSETRVDNGYIRIEWDGETSFADVKLADVQVRDAAAVGSGSGSDSSSRSSNARRPTKRRCERSAASRALAAAMALHTKLQPVVLEGLREVYGDEVTDDKYFDSVCSYQEMEGHLSMVSDKARNAFYAQSLATCCAAWMSPRAGPLLVCDVGCGPTALLTRLAVREYESAVPSAAKRAHARFVAIDIGAQTCAAARRSLRDDPLSVAVDVTHADAGKGKGRKVVASSDVVIHEVFGVLASIEGFTRWAHRAARATVVPDTAATLFHLVDYDDALRAFPRGARIGERIALARVAFEHCTATSADVGVLELFAGGSTRGGAAAWGADQRHESTFRIRRRGDISALGCFISIGNGGVDDDCVGVECSGGAACGGGSSTAAATPRARSATPRPTPARRKRSSRQVQPAQPFALAHAPPGARGAAATLPRRKHWTTSDARDARWSSSNWKNVLLLLPRPLRVKAGDKVVVVATVVGLETKAVRYACAVTLYRATRQIGGTMDVEVTQRDVFPWWDER